MGVFNRAAEIFEQTWKGVPTGTDPEGHPSVKAQESAGHIGDLLSLHTADNLGQPLTEDEADALRTAQDVLTELAGRLKP